MKYRILGKTGLKVSEVGFGTWQLTDGGMWVGAEPKQGLKNLHLFADSGGNFIDTAWEYGYSDEHPNRHPSEELIGKFLKESKKRDKMIIASKVPPKNRYWPALKGIPASEVFPKDHIEKCIDDSLKSLGLDTIDLMQFHVWQDDFVKEDEWKEAIQKTVKSGKVRFWGISVNDYQPSNCSKTLDSGLIATIQFVFNIFHQKPTEKLLPYAKKNNIGLIVRVPLDEGGLSGKFTLQTKFPKGDFRSFYFSPKRLKELIKRTDKLKKLLNDEAKALAELDLLYILSFEEISTVIPGMRKPEHIRANVSVSDGRKLSFERMEELKKHSWERNFYPDVDQSMRDTNYIEA